MASEDLPANGHGGPADPKSALRRRTRDVRMAYVASLGAGQREVLERSLAAQLAAHLPAGVVAGYAAAGSEIGLGFVERITLWPRVVAGAPLGFHAGPPLLASRPGSRGVISEPPASATPGDPDIVLVPLLAVDARGMRLGQGGGHYDRTLASLRRAGRVLAVGIAWDVQCVDALPTDPWDEPLDALATPSGWRAFAPSPMSRR